MDYKQLFETMPAGVVVADHHLRIHYMNPFARQMVFALAHAEDDPADVLLSETFFTTDRQRFDMGGCMRNMISSRKRVFHKTLIVKKQGGELLVYFTARGFRQQGSDFILLMISDISAEMDCIVHSPGSFPRKQFFLEQTIIGRDEKIRALYRMITLAADSGVNVMVSGESGTGKELVADAIHYLSDRSKGPLVKVNCSALSEHLLESELFGHVKGAFTGAIKDKTGKFEEASGGTIFLDEVGEISLSLQVKLLRVIQEKTIERVGDNKTIRLNLRIIAATNRNLRERIASKEFREDLFYRLNVFAINMPPLRERRLDIPLLCDHFIVEFNLSTGKRVKGVGREALQLLMRYPWPGNIRELRNAIEHAFVLVQAQVIQPDDLPENIREYQPGHRDAGPGYEGLPGSGATGFAKTPGGRLQISKEQLDMVLEAHAFNQTRTADYLGISRVALWKKMKKFGL